MGDNTSTDSESEELVIVDIPENLEPSWRPAETCIYRIHPSIRRLNEAAYTPQLVSIGPFHYGKPELKGMEIHKLRYLRFSCQRLNDHMTEKQAVDHLSRIIKECEEQIRHCYEEPCEIRSSEFVQMILLDAIFIIEYSLRQYNNQSEDDFILSQQSINTMIYLDLHLIENQLPFFILKRLYATTPISRSLNFRKLICLTVLRVSLPKESLLDNTKHFIDLVRYGMLDDSLQRFQVGTYSKLKYSASKLHQAGVKFEAVDHESKLKLDVEFTNGVLKIPTFEVHDFSELYIRNVMAFERRCYPEKSFICSYFFLMDHLINTAEDVDLLVDAGIILHWHGSNEVFAAFINKLCKGMIDYGICYDSLYKQLNDHYENKCNHLKANLKLVYFSNVWRGTGTVAAAVLLLMTLLQTISSVKSL